MSALLAQPAERIVSALPSVVSRTVGNALVIHPTGAIDAEVNEIALAVAADPDHDLVLLDLPADSSAERWEEAAALLPRSRRGVRIVFRNRSRESVALAGQWLAGRLGTAVLVPDGVVVPGAGGSLFVDPLDGTGWVRLHRRRPAVRESRRFPKPEWDVAALADVVQTSASVQVEPLPGGAWVHARRSSAEVAAHRDRLQRALPAHRGSVYLVLGCPGDPPLSLDDVARFWHAVPANLRGSLRPVRYGPIDLAEGVDWAQALADLLDTAVTGFTGLPVGPADDPEVHTVLSDGVLGWRSRAREVGYLPRRVEASAPVPRIVSHQSPVPAALEVTPKVYWYAPDAVVEVVPAGLWIRPAEEPAHAAQVRSVLQRPERHLLVFEDGTPEEADRMSKLAADLLAQLDEATRRLNEMQASSEVRAGLEEPAEASSPQRVDDVVPAALPGRGHVEVGAATAAPALLGPAVPQLPAPQRSPGAIDRFERAVLAVPTPAPARGPAPAAPRDAAVRIPDVAAPAVLSAAEPAAAESAPAGIPTAPQPSKPSAPRVAAEPVAVSAAAQASAAEQPRLEVRPEPPRRSVTPVVWKQQTMPVGAASVQAPAAGLERERTWLQKAMRDQFVGASNSVARVLSENPAFSGALARSSDDVLTDSVAVRIHLSTATDRLSGPLRRGEVGSHVPLARCTVSGLARLPSHRGVTGLVVEADDVPWGLLESSSHLTEWGFLEGAVGVAAPGGGDLDVAVWSLTARRTRLLEPATAEGAERVLFLPGTSFVVLDVRRPTGSDRGRILLRELAAAEVDENGGLIGARKGLDELALSSLRAAFSTPSAPTGSSRARAGSLPGLVVDAAAAGAR